MMGGGTINPPRMSFALEEGASEKLAEIGEWLGSSRAEVIKTSVALMSLMKNLGSEDAEVTVVLGGTDKAFQIKKGAKVYNLHQENERMSDESISEIRDLIEKLEKSLSAIGPSNSLRNEIVSDIEQTKIEINREIPRKKILVIFLESLRDNFAKAAGGGVVAAIGALLAKYFGVF